MGVWQGEGRQVRGTGASSQLSGPRPWDFQKSQSHLRFGSGAPFESRSTASLGLSARVSTYVCHTPIMKKKINKETETSPSGM